MNMEKLEAKLFAAARNHLPSQEVPYAFEKRIMARLTKPVVDMWFFWGRALWRAAVVSLVMVVLLGSWSWQSELAAKTDLSQDLENAVFAGFYESQAFTMSEDNW